LLNSVCPAQKQLHVLDACNAGAIDSAFLSRGAGDEIALSRLSRAVGSALIASSRADQFAQEFATLGQGALTNDILGQPQYPTGFAFGEDFPVGLHAGR